MTTDTTGLFRKAVDTVRSFPLSPRERRPAFVLPRPPATPAPRGDGAAEGRPGDLWSVAEALRSGRAFVREIAARSQERIAAHSRRLHAFEHLADVTGTVLALGEEASRGVWRGPLHGIPMSVKDVIDVQGMPTTGSSIALPSRIAVRDALAVARLRAAGAVIIGKAVTHEFALGVTTPQSHNPWDEARVPGGSSGGSAISIVTGMALGSLGTDTRASIRVPAALCGVVGFKASYDLVPVDSWLTLSWSMDHIAPMARSVRDIALLMDVLTGSGEHYRSLLPGSLRGRRIAYSDSLLTNSEAGVRRVVEAALAAMEAAGAAVVRAARPSAEDLDLANAAGLIVSRAEAAQAHREAGTVLDRCIPEVRDQLREAMRLEAADYLRALRLRGQLRDSLAALFDGVDALVMPTSKVVAPLRQEADKYLLALSENCVPWSLVDFPAMSVPAGTSGGLPVGLQFVAAPGQDDLLLSLSHGFERVAPVPPEWRPQ